MKILRKLKNKEIQEKIINRFILFGYLPLGILIAIFTPDDILKYNWARAFTDCISGWIPWVADVGRHTPVPATQFIAAVMNCIAILIGFGMVFMMKWYSEEGIEKLRTEKRKNLAFEISFMLFMFFSNPSIFFNTHGRSAKA